MRTFEVGKEVFGGVSFFFSSSLFVPSVPSHLTLILRFFRARAWYLRSGALGFVDEFSSVEERQGSSLVVCLFTGAASLRERVLLERVDL